MIPGFRSAWNFLVLCMLVAAPTVHAQEPAATPAHEDEQIPEFRIGVKVDLVMMHTSVFDRENRFIDGLTQDRFKVYEDGEPQKIQSFSREDVPVSMGILIDLSGSMRDRMEQVKNAALAFIRAGNPDDQTFLVGFNDKAELLQDYTSDIDEIMNALDRTVVAGGTALYDAIYLGVEKARNGVQSKKAIVVITDGVDKDSYFKLNELIAQVQESDVQVFCVGFFKEIPKRNIFSDLWRLWSDSEEEKAYDALVRISRETGGKAFFPRETSEIHDIVVEIANELRSQYGIGYFSSNPAMDGAFRKVKIELTGKTKNLQIRHRRGYFAPRKE
jgi:Ca-activated chloride channel family protein